MESEKIIRIGRLAYCHFHFIDEADELQDKDGRWVLNKLFWRFYWLTKPN